VPDAQSIAERFFLPAEAAELKPLPEAERAQTFLRLWTRKEALAKAVGAGIANSLARYAVTSGSHAAVLAIDGEAALAAQWTLHSFVPASGHVGALAVHSPSAQFTLHEFALPS
jgi:4'-phosphopantetheinyl transferase